MRDTITTLCALAFLLFSAPLGCTNDNNDNSDTSDGTNGTSTCASYKYSFCAYAVDCGILPRTASECRDFLGDIPCITERLAGDCRKAIDEADCTNPPARCDVLDVLDRSEAIEACEYDRDTECAMMDQDCDYGYARCVAEMESVAPCESVVKLARDPQACFDAIQTLKCDDEYPEACKDLFIYM